MPDEQQESQDQHEEEFDSEAWLNDIRNQPDPDDLEDEAAREAADEKQQRAIRKEAREELDELKAERKRERFERKVEKFVDSIKEDDPRHDFLWVLKGVKNQESFQQAVDTIAELGKQKAAALKQDQQDEKDTLDAFGPPVPSGGEGRTDRKKELWERLDKGAKGTDRALAEIEIFMGDSQLFQRLQRGSQRK
jgi:hypothetical protein